MKKNIERPNRTAHTDLFLEKHYLLATLPKKETKHNDFLKRLNRYLGKLNRENFLVFDYSARFPIDIKTISEIFGGVSVYYNDYLNLFANASREDSGAFFSPDYVFLNPFISDYYKVNETDRQKNVVVCITNDPYIATEIVGKTCPAFSKLVPEITQNVKRLWGEKVKSIAETGYNTVLSLNFQNKSFGSIRFN